MSKEKPENPVKEAKEVSLSRVDRGGYWNRRASGTGPSCRHHYHPSNNYDGFGFRIARTKK